MPRQQLDAMGQIAQRVLGENLSQELLCGRLCDGLEITLGAATPAV